MEDSRKQQKHFPGNKEEIACKATGKFSGEQCVIFLGRKWGISWETTGSFLKNHVECLVGSREFLEKYISSKTSCTLGNRLQSHTPAPLSPPPLPGPWVRNLSGSLGCFCCSPQSSKGSGKSRAIAVAALGPLSVGAMGRFASARCRALPAALRPFLVCHFWQHGLSVQAKAVGRRRIKINIWTRPGGFQLREAPAGVGAADPPRCGIPTLSFRSGLLILISDTLGRAVRGVRNGAAGAGASLGQPPQRQLRPAGSSGTFTFGRDT